MESGRVQLLAENKRRKRPSIKEIRVERATKRVGESKNACYLRTQGRRNKSERIISLGSLTDDEFQFMKQVIEGWAGRVPIEMRCLSKTAESVCRCFGCRDKRKLQNS